MGIFRISIINSYDEKTYGPFAFTTDYCEGYPSDSTLKSYLLSSAKLFFAGGFGTLTSLNFSVDPRKYPMLKCKGRITGGGFISNRGNLPPVYISEIIFRIRGINNIISNSVGLEKHLTDENPLIRELVKRELV